MRKTPALAGRTSRAVAERSIITENPRARGANLMSPLAKRASGGKPPRSRGEPPKEILVADGERKTPALAGRTLDHLAGTRPCWENPRARGANPHNQIITIVH